jgi:type III pantothenate kinase
VAIDLGTCIKFDFVDEKGIFHGGSISPGLNMRLKAMHHFTGKLPLVEPKKGVNYLGRSSEESILAGVIEGMQGELNHFISRYLQDYQGLTFFVTGGDAKFFDFPLKNNIFANENLTLTGLYKIYLLNA